MPGQTTRPSPTTSSTTCTLPLHTSQREVGCGEGYTDFALDIRPSIDFISELMSKTDGLDVLEPASLKARIHRILEEALKRNS